MGKSGNENASRTVISFSEALREFLGVWEFDAKLSKDVPGSVKADRVMKKAKVPLARRLGVQYLVGNEVSQSISLEEEEGKLKIEAFIKGISAWSKEINLFDQTPYYVKDPLFGSATCHAYYEPSKKELHYVLDSKYKEKGRLSTIRVVEGDIMRTMMRWFPSSEDDTIFITHHRLYKRKGPPLSMAEVLQKKRRKSKLMQSLSTKGGAQIATDATKLASSMISNRNKKDKDKDTPKTAPEQPEPEIEEKAVTIEHKPQESTPSTGYLLIKSLALPITALVVSFILFFVFTRWGMSK